MITLIDIGLGNIASVGFALDRLGADWRISTSADDVAAATHVILPGVGSFPEGMSRLRGHGLIEPIRRHALSKKLPLLGICLGMQLLADEGEEHGTTSGLGLVPGRVICLEGSKTDRVPNIGWCEVEARPTSTLLSGLTEQPAFYFVHSYHLVCKEQAHVAATLSFAGKPIVAAVENANVFGVQFHPEKSQDAGLELLRNFIGL